MRPAAHDSDAGAWAAALAGGEVLYMKFILKKQPYADWIVGYVKGASSD